MKKSNRKVKKVSENQPFRGSMKERKESVFMYPSFRAIKRASKSSRRTGSVTQIIPLVVRELACGLTIVKSGKGIRHS